MKLLVAFVLVSFYLLNHAVPGETSKNRAALGFQSLEWDHHVHATVEVDGRLPSWLQGALYRNGPGKWLDPKTAHWFLGLAFLQEFRFRGLNDTANTITYTAQFLKTTPYNTSHPVSTVEQGINDLDSPNSEVTIRRIQSDGNAHLLANSAETESNEFDHMSLDTVAAPFLFNDDHGSDSAPSHAHTDLHGNVVHFAHFFSPTFYTRIYEIPYKTRVRNFTGQVPVNPRIKASSFEHSFALTEHYVIRSEIPAGMTDGPFSGYTFDPSIDTTWRVVSRNTGLQVAEFTSDAFFFFHHVNAYENETDQTIVIDLLQYTNMDILSDLYLDVILNHPEKTRASFCQSKLVRYTLPMKNPNSRVEGRQVTPIQCLELPTIHYAKLNTLPHQYVYAVGYHSAETSDMIDQLVKIDVTSGAYATWHEEDCYPGEPIFVPSPEAKSEDDGIILSEVLDAKRETSFLVILDAKSFTLMAKAYLPCYGPFGFHGRQYSDL